MTTPRSSDALGLRTAGGVTVVVGVIAAVIGMLVGGGKGLLGAVIATVIVVVFFSIGQFTLGAVLKSNPQMALTVALMIYLVKVGVLLVLIILFSGTTLFDTKVFAATIVAGTLAWTGAEVWVFARTKVLYVEPAGDR
jgi:ATP synthase protein I